MRNRIITKKIFGLLLLLMTVFALSACSASKGEDVQSIETGEDYMITYYNYYGIETGTDQYKQIAESTIEALLAKTFGIKSMYDDGVDLKTCSETFLRDIGMNDEEILSLRKNLGGIE